MSLLFRHTNGVNYVLSVNSSESFLCVIDGCIQYDKTDIEFLVDSFCSIVIVSDQVLRMTIELILQCLCDEVIIVLGIVVADVNAISVVRTEEHKSSEC